MKPVLLLLFAASAAFGETVSVGSLPYGVQLIFGGNPAITIIDTSRPATASGAVTTATIGWGAGAPASCDGAFIIKFCRPSGTSLQLVAQRGPFISHLGLITVALDPPVPLLKGDYIAVQRLPVPSSCGQPLTAIYDGSGALYIGDVEAGFTQTSSFLSHTGSMLVAIASDTPAVRVAIIPAVASAQGSLTSFFRTALQLTNPTDIAISGKLVFHRQGVPGTEGDPSLDYALAPRQTVSFKDIVASMGQNGLGSIDLFAASSYPAIAEARVYHDGGDGGTAGFSERVFRMPAQVKFGGATVTIGYLSIPNDLTNFRFNIGIRTVNAATIGFSLYDAAGNWVTGMDKPYPAESFEQKPATEVFGLSALPAGGSIQVNATEFFMLYGASTDNHTQDPSVRFATVY